MTVAHRRAMALTLPVALALVGCSGEAEPDTENPPRPGPPTAVWEVVDSLREDMARPRHPSDGGGRAWLVAATPAPEFPRIVAGGRARFDLIYEAGPLGVAVGGSVLLQTSPFWGWSTPQTDLPDVPGYTEVSTRPRV